MSQRTLVELLHGQGAHTDPQACIEDLSLALAGRRPDGFPHSIYQLTWHMNFWMDYDLRRTRGEKPPYPRHASEGWPANPAPSTDAEWKTTVTRFAQLIATHVAMADWSPEELNRRVEATHPSHETRSSTVLAILWGTVAHNSYHVGQIAQVRRALGVWPPPRGGDTW
ncbi:MAG TPA: DinB family protein [Candidatus Eremiobacteraceae bacterium]|nr:DinB family protein [Candidatus Eremiobacteraceae bacterium]